MSKFNKMKGGNWSEKMKKIIFNVIYKHSFEKLIDFCTRLHVIFFCSFPIFFDKICIIRFSSLYITFKILFQLQRRTKKNKKIKGNI